MDSDDVAYVQDPLARVQLPSVSAPSLRVTVPVAVAGVTVAVNVMPLPTIAGLALETSALKDVPTLTVSMNAEDDDGSCVLSPPYDAVRLCDPAPNMAVENVQLPADNVHVPRTVAPSLMVTVPVAPVVTVAVKVTLSPYVLVVVTDESDVIVER